MFFNLFIFNNYSNLFISKKIYFYKILIIFYKFNLCLPLLYSNQFKYSWIETKTKFDKFYLSNFNNNHFIEFTCINVRCDFFNKYSIINNYIRYKNKLGVFKRINSIKNSYLLKYNLYKRSFFEKNYVSINNELIFKNFDFIERKLFFLKNNRKILKNVFKKNKKIEQFINKFLKKISKTSNFDFLNFFEFSLNNVLINSGFFLSKNDTYFFIKNQYIYVNNKVNTKINFELSSGDIINLSFNKYYYFLFRKSVNSLNLNINKYGNFFRKSISHDLNKDFSFIGKLTIIQNDIPAYLEVDYISMSMILLYKNIYSYNHFDLKLLPVFLKRLNNWKFIV